MPMATQRPKPTGSKGKAKANIQAKQKQKSKAVQKVFSKQSQKQSVKMFYHYYITCPCPAVTTAKLVVIGIANCGVALYLQVVPTLFSVLFLSSIISSNDCFNPSRTSSEISTLMATIWCRFLGNRDLDHPLRIHFETTEELCNFIGPELRCTQES